MLMRATGNVVAGHIIWPAGRLLPTPDLGSQSHDGTSVCLWQSSDKRLFTQVQIYGKF